MTEKSLFTAAGHLTDHAFERLLKQNLTELQRLEIAEHLSFCDACMQRYAKFLTDDKLNEPLEPVLPALNRINRKKRMNDITYRYLTVAAAACLALTFWGIGVFDLGTLHDDETRPTNVLQNLVEGTDELLKFGSQSMQKLDESWSDIRNNVLISK